MKIKRWIAILVSICVLQLITFSAMGDTNSETTNEEEESSQNGIKLDDVEINVSGVPIEDLFGTAFDMFTEVFEENMGDMLEGLNGVFGEFAEEMSEDLGEIETILGSMIEGTWLLNIPAVSFDAKIRRSAYDNAFDLYEAQLNGETCKEGRIALNSTEGSLNDILYIYDGSEIITSITKAIEDGEFGEQEIVFGLEGYTGTYAVSSVLFLSPSDEPYAMCNMTDLTQEQQFESYRDYVTEHAVKNYDVLLEYGDQILTVIFWNEDSEAEWLTVVAKEVPMMLE